MININQVLIFSSAMLLAACSTKDKELPTTAPKIVSVTLEQDKAANQKEDHQLVVMFDRPFTDSELKAGYGYHLKYATKYLIQYSDGAIDDQEFENNITEFILDKDKKSFTIADEQGNQPKYGMDEIVDKRWKKGGIKKIQIELYQRDDVDNLDSNFKLIDQKKFVLDQDLAFVSR